MSCSTCSPQVDEKLHGEKGTTYAEVSDKIDAAIERLKKTWGRSGRRNGLGRAAVDNHRQEPSHAFDPSDAGVWPGGTVDAGDVRDRMSAAPRSIRMWQPCGSACWWAKSPPGRSRLPMHGPWWSKARRSPDWSDRGAGSEAFVEGRLRL